MSFDDIPGNRAQRRDKGYVQAVWETRLDSARKESARILLDIRRGVVNEIDLDRLENFVRVSLVQMERHGFDDWLRSRNRAELLDLLHHPDPRDFT